MLRHRNKVIEEIYSSGWLEKHCRSVCSDRQLADDLVQEVALIILETKPDSSLDKAISRGEHLPFIKRIINNQYCSKTSAFWRKYRQHIGIEFKEGMEELDV